MDSKSSSNYWIIFIVLVASVAVVVFLKYIYLITIIRTAQEQNIAANLTASTASNYTLRKANPDKGMAVKNCQDVPDIAGEGLPRGYTILSQNIDSGQVVMCILNTPKMRSVQFSVIGIS